MLLDPSALPHLRVLDYWDGHVTGLDSRRDEFLLMSVEELAAECDTMCEEEECDTPGNVMVFFAFCRVVVTRGLVTPLQSRHGMLLPEQEHSISADCFNY